MLPGRHFRPTRPFITSGRKHVHKDRKQLGRTWTTSIVQSGKGSWRHRWALRRCNHVNTEKSGGQRRAWTTPFTLTGDLSFPSDAANVNDWCLHIHDYTPVSRSRFLAARLNNGSKHQQASYVSTRFTVRVCVAIEHTLTLRHLRPYLMISPRTNVKWLNLDLAVDSHLTWHRLR